MANVRRTPYKLDEVVKKFVDAMNKRHPAALTDLAAFMGPHRTTEEIFEKVWCNKEAQILLSNSLKPPISSKNDEQAYRTRVLGELHFAKENYDMALKCFNDCILYATHPTHQPQEDEGPASNSQTNDDNRQLRKDANTPDNSFSGSVEQGAASPGSSLGFSEEGATSPDSALSSGWGTHEQLSQGYDARAKLLFKLKKFDLCIRDIDLVLGLGCPQENRDYLNGLRIACLKRKTLARKGLHGEATLPAFRFVRPDHPTLSQHNPTMPALSKAVEMAYTADQGRHLIAGRDIFPGELLAVEESYVSALNGKCVLKYCCMCLLRSATPLPCHHCNKVMFCSLSCQSEGMSGSHGKECPVLVALYSLSSDNFLAMGFRLMVKVGLHKVLHDFYGLRMEAMTTDPAKLGFNGIGKYDGEDYRSMFHLVANRDKRSPKDLLEKCLQASILLRLLQRSGKFFIMNGAPYPPHEVDYIIVGSTLLHHLLGFSSNTYSVAELQEYGPGLCHGKMSSYGTAVFPTISLFNFGCVESCTQNSYGKMMVVRAMRFVPAGRTLYISHGQPYQSHSLQKRNNICQMKFKYTCTCDACMYKWPVMENMVHNHAGDEIMLKCIKCLKALDPDVKKCLKCRLSYAKREPVPGNPTLTTYNYDFVMREMTQALSKVMRAHADMMIRSRLTNNEWQAYYKTAELFCKYMVEPHPLFRFVFDLRASYCTLGTAVWVGSGIA